MYLPDGTPLPESSCPMTVARKEQRALPGLETLIERPDGTRTPFIIYPAPLPGSPRSFINLLVDISTRKESEAHTRALLSQLIHREKNEIQTIQSLLAGALREAQSSEARDVLADTARRVGALAAAQNAIDRHGGGIFAAESLLEALCRNAAQSFGRILDIHVERASGALPNRAALPLAIIVNELVTNSVKHARGDRSRVAVGLAFMQEHHNSLLTVQDDGPGFTPGPPKRRASGLGLVEGLARQLGGAVEITTRNGALCTLRFPN
jgi:two-component sensor histidine kinase